MVEDALEKPNGDILNLKEREQKVDSTGEILGSSVNKKARC